MADLIDRDKAIDTVYTMYERWDTGMTKDLRDMIAEALRVLPPERKTGDDSINRQEAIDTLDVGAEFLRRVLDDADIVGVERAKYEWGLGLIESYISDMKELPSAQPERKTGKWETTRPDAPMFGFYYCPFCGRKRTSPQDNFCPNCGADMRGEGNETD